MIGRTIRRFDILPVACSLDRAVGLVQHIDDMGVGVQLIRAINRLGPRIGDGMFITCAALCRDEVVVAVFFEEMRRLHQSQIAAGEDVLDLTCEAFLRMVVFLQKDPAKQLFGRCVGVALGGEVVPDHVDEPFAPFVIVKERRIKAGGVHVDRIAPRSVDAVGCDQIVVRVLEAAVEPFDVCVDQPKFAIGVAQCWGPDAAGIGIAAHVELIRAVQRLTYSPPVYQVARLADLHAGVPFEGWRN